MIYQTLTEGQTFFFWLFLAWHDPKTQGVQELILGLFKVHSQLTYGWKSIRFWWYFHTFHENGDEVLLKFRLKTPTKTILGVVLFMYLLTNTKIARIQFFYDPTCCCLADFGQGVSKVWYKWPKEKSMLLAYFSKKWQKHKKNFKNI